MKIEQYFGSISDVISALREAMYIADEDVATVVYLSHEFSAGFDNILIYQ
jgi:hypothetical protein